MGLNKEAPAGRRVESRPISASQVLALPRIGGLHHQVHLVDGSVRTNRFGPGDYGIA